ncbi:MAG: Hsp33 family molecular chaperone HslO, partial [Lachnospiraceae bacterium]
ATSEQVPSAVGLGVLDEQRKYSTSGWWFVLQLMPFAEEKVIAGWNRSWSNISNRHAGCR